MVGGSEQPRGWSVAAAAASVYALTLIAGCADGAASGLESAPPPPAVAAGDAAATCAGCHRGIEVPGDAHADIVCEACHVEPLASATGIGIVETRRPTGHPEVAANPSHPSTWKAACGDCHADALARMERSLHWTQAGIINHTRFLWGAQDRVAPPVITLPEMAAASVPELRDAGAHAPAVLVDDLLRRRCLRCHLLAGGGGGDGLHRGAGCAACHVPYADDGRYAGADEAVRRAGSAGRPAFHRIEKPTTSDPCLRCHNGHATGADYVGLFEADAHDDYRIPLADGRERPMLYGRDHHRLTADVHRDAGLICVDCHGQDEVMGRTRGRIPALARDAVGIRCDSCHGDLAGLRTGTVPDGLGRGPKRVWRLTPRAAVDSPRVVPRAAAYPGAGEHPAHDPMAHGRVACSACHSAWAGQTFGTHAHLSREPIWNLWIPRDAQGDPELARRVAEAEALDEASRDVLPPRMTDRLTGAERDGIWAVGHTLRRWEEPALGMTVDGRIAALRPRHQFHITFVGEDGLVWLDSVVPTRGDGAGDGWASEPFTPHTTMAGGASCLRCHGNPRAAGRGITWAADTPPLHPETVPSPPATPRTRLLRASEQEALLSPSDLHRAVFAGILSEMGLEDWLPEEP